MDQLRRPVNNATVKLTINDKELLAKCIGNGTYVAEVDTTDFEEGEYIVNITGHKEFYKPAQYAEKFKVKPRGVTISIITVISITAIIYILSSSLWRIRQLKKTMEQ